MSWEKEKGPEDEKLWWGFMLGVEISPHCRPLWLTHHSPLLEESKGGQWLPANRTQVEKETKKNILFYRSGCKSILQTKWQWIGE